MPKFNLLIAFTFISLASMAQGVQRVSAVEFSQLLRSNPGAAVIDVRTVGEFQGGHLSSAINYPLNSGDFGQKIGSLDKSKPVFVYCLSGARSNAAAQQMSAMGFTSVYDMAGGMMQWRVNGLPESNASKGSAKKGMTMAAYQQLTRKKSLVLIDFYAEWCAPCKKMKPFLEEINREMGSTVEVIRIDSDAEKELCRQLKVDALPALVLYQDGKEVWKHKEFASKNDIVAKIKQFSNK